MKTKVTTVGAALGLGAQLRGTGKAPVHLMRSDLVERLALRGVALNWTALIEEGADQFSDRLEHWPEVRKFVAALSQAVKIAQEEDGKLLVVGGDHAIAMGTWPGVVNYHKAQQKFGLIWIDAHMDAHTAETSPSAAMHGMPVAGLLGEGKTAWESTTPYLKPEHVALIGIRSFESGEAALLAEKGVKIYPIEEVHKRGFETVFDEAVATINDAVDHFGVSLDLDGIDPQFAPGVGSPEPNGINAADILSALKHLKKLDSFKAFELVEFNPDLDKDQKTEKLIEEILVSIYSKE